MNRKPVCDVKGCKNEALREVGISINHGVEEGTVEWYKDVCPVHVKKIKAVFGD